MARGVVAWWLSQRKVCMANEQELFSTCSLVLSTFHASHGQYLYYRMNNMIQIISKRKSLNGSGNLVITT